MELVSP
ncbi:hypothetical protein D030_5427A, partial [Vibrio parahaemolyticus AQ3810]